jgi:AraC-like DNA-binding protein
MVKRAMHYTCRAPLFAYPHQHENIFHLSYVITGHSRIEVDDACYEIGPDSAIFIRPGQIHVSIGDARTNYELIEIKFSVSSYHVETAVPDLPPVFHVQNPAAFLPALERLVSAWLVAGSEDNWLSRLRLTECLYLLAKEAGLLEVTKVADDFISRKIRQAADYIAVNYSRPITVELLSELVGLSESHFAACFKKVMAVSPVEYVIRTRMYHAEELLHDSSFSVGQIAAICGFSSPHYFSRLFARRHTASPTQYRRSGAKGSTKLQRIP